MLTTTTNLSPHQRLTDVIHGIVLSSVKQQSLLQPKPINLDEGDQSRLFGTDGQLDSMGLVSLVVEIEERIEVELRQQIVIASAKAMSSRHSPFATVCTLVQHIVSTIEEAEQNV